MNKLLLDFDGAKQAIYEHTGFVEGWTVYAINDHTGFFWRVTGDFVDFAISRERMADGSGDIYTNILLRPLGYKEKVYRGKELTLIIMDTNCDGNKFFGIFDTAKEVT